MAIKIESYKITNIPFCNGKEASMEQLMKHAGMEQINENSLVDSYGSIFWFVNGKNHIDGNLSSIQYKDGEKYFHENGFCIRFDNRVYIW